MVLKFLVSDDNNAVKLMNAFGKLKNKLVLMGYHGSYWHLLIIDNREQRGLEYSIHLFSLAPPFGEIGGLNEPS